MSKNSWHFPRLTLAKQVTAMFTSGLSSALVFFAPRRMGKTEFLLKDITPTAEQQGWQVFYHSFLDANKHVETTFAKALQQNTQTTAISIKKITQQHQPLDFAELLKKIAKQQKLMLLLDEIQVLAKDEANLSFLTSLRTTLDTHKECISVIFTGSSREGLKKMFSAKDAPFFHFGQNLSFPEFGPEFTTHLAKKYHEITHKKMNEQALWSAFEELGKIPQLIRSLVERMVLYPELGIDDAKEALLGELTEDRSFETQWNHFSALEQRILWEIASKTQKLYSAATRQKIASQLGIPHIPISTMQSALRKLNRNAIIGIEPVSGDYFMDDPNFQEWVLQQ